MVKVTLGLLKQHFLPECQRAVLSNVDLYFTINMVVTIIKTTLTRKQT